MKLSASFQSLYSKYEFCHYTGTITLPTFRSEIYGRKRLGENGATDGHRLAYVEKQEPIEGSMDALIPKKALVELTKIARDTNSDVSFGEDQIIFILKLTVGFYE